MSEGVAEKLDTKELQMKHATSSCEAKEQKVSPYEYAVNKERLETVAEKTTTSEEKVATTEKSVTEEETASSFDGSQENVSFVESMQIKSTNAELNPNEPATSSMDSDEIGEETKHILTIPTVLTGTDIPNEKKNVAIPFEAAINEATNISSPPTSSNDEHNLKEAESKQSCNEKYAEHVTYAEDGTAIYTDPKTNYQYQWCTKENNWIPKGATTFKNPYENEHYKWCEKTQKWIPKQTQVTETEHYKWNAEQNQWVAKIKDKPTGSEQKDASEISYGIDENGQRTHTDKDGTVFFWDVEKNAWFPKIDDEFMARYQMNYGFIDNTSESEREKEKQKLEAELQKEKELIKMVEEAKANEEASKEAAKHGIKRKPQQEPPKWFEMDPVHNTKVYVSNLPLDITLDEFAEVMGKCGMIMRDPQTQNYKLKLYTESDGQIKGDGLCDYIKVESVDLALNILDEYDLRGHKLRVQRAQFQMRGEYNPALKPKRKKKDKEKLAKIKEKLFDWRPEKMRGERLKHEKTVIIKNLFSPELFEKEVQLILDYQNDLREECSKCGSVRKVVIYDRHLEGVAQINMAAPEEADLVIQMMHGRYFGKRQLTAEHWDGKTKYKSEETQEEVQKRLNKWDQYLESEDNKKTLMKNKEKEAANTLQTSDSTSVSCTENLEAKELHAEPDNPKNTETRNMEETQNQSLAELEMKT